MFFMPADGVLIVGVFSPSSCQLQGNIDRPYTIRSNQHPTLELTYIQTPRSIDHVRLPSNLLVQRRGITTTHFHERCLRSPPRGPASTRETIPTFQRKWHGMDPRRLSTPPTQTIFSLGTVTAQDFQFVPQEFAETLHGSPQSIKPVAGLGTRLDSPEFSS